MQDGELENGLEATRTFSVFTDPSLTQSTVIVGAGIIGCATAYYLSRSGNTKPDTIHLIEASPELFASASGKGAGFLAADCMLWCDLDDSWVRLTRSCLGFAPSTASLGELSFKLHKELADQNDGKKQWGYSRSTGTSLTEGTSGSGGRGYDWLRDGRSRAEAAGVHEFKGDDNGPAWLARKQGDQLELLSKDNTVAQV